MSGGPTASLPLEGLPGIGPARAALFTELGVIDQRDLVFFAPRAWRDLARVGSVGALIPGREATVRAKLARLARPFRLRGGRVIVRGVFTDGTGSLSVTWFNAPYLAKDLCVGREYLVTGKVEGKRAFSMVNPELEPDEPALGPLIHAGRIVPVYPATGGLSRKTIRRAVWEALKDVLPEWDWEWPGRSLPLGKLLNAFHFPENLAASAAARQELVSRELFLFQVAVLRDRVRDQARPARRLPCGSAVDRRIRARFPFRFTAEQDRAIAEVTRDLARGSPMRRLLQGEVGSGKTAVALYACLVAVANGAQAAVLAPTRALAEQHARNFGKMLSGSRVKTALLAGLEPGGATAAVRKGLAQGTVDLVVGTHALLERPIRFRNLALLVIDEQHRFGVAARERLAGLADPAPHCLSMTATPIPRTLAMAFYGELDVSEIRGRPPGRAPVSTLWVRPAPKARKAAFAEIRRRIVAMRERAYVVCPAIDGACADEVRSVSEVAKRLTAGAFQGVPLDVLHGRLSAENRTLALARFVSGKSRVLVATSLVEVGLDVPEATLMVVADADRFGLSQLHQLRGRVGRGNRPGRCYLFADPKTPEAVERLKILETTDDGFSIAEKDLALRGSGERFGEAQSGFSRFFRVADLARDAGLAVKARAEASAWMRSAPRWPTEMENELKNRLLRI